MHGGAISAVTRMEALHSMRPLTQTQGPFELTGPSPLEPYLTTRYNPHDEVRSHRLRSPSWTLPLNRYALPLGRAKQLPTSSWSVLPQQLSPATLLLCALCMFELLLLTSVPSSFSHFPLLPLLCLLLTGLSSQQMHVCSCRTFLPTRCPLLLVSNECKYSCIFWGPCLATSQCLHTSEFRCRDIWL